MMNDTLLARLVAVVMALVAVWLAYIAYVNAMDFYSHTVTELFQLTVLQVRHMQASFVIPSTIAFILLFGAGCLWYYAVPEHERYLRNRRR